MKRLIFIACGLFTVALAGCSREQMLKMVTRPEDEATAKQYIELLREDKFDEVQNDLDPSIKDDLDHDTFEKMRALIPEGEPLDVKLVGSTWKAMGSSRSVNITFEYHFPGKWLLINVATQKDGDVTTITGFRVQPMGGSLDTLNRFTLAGKGGTQYAMLGLFFAEPLFIMCIMVVCIRAHGVKRKWLWVIFILIGVGKWTVNWTTGQLFFAPLSLEVPGVSASAVPYGPWMISASVPVGAIVFLLKWRRLVSGPRPPNVPPGTSEKDTDGEGPV